MVWAGRKKSSKVFKDMTKEQYVAFVLTECVTAIRRGKLDQGIARSLCMPLHVSVCLHASACVFDMGVSVLV